MKKALAALISSAMLISLAACGGGSSSAPSGSQAAPGDSSSSQTAMTGEAAPGGEMAEGEMASFQVADNDEDIYMNNLGDFYEEFLKATTEAENVSERYAMLAQAEAKVLESGAGTPMYGGTAGYQMSHIIPKTGGYAPWRGEMSDMGQMIITNEVIKSEDHEYLKQLWLDNLGTGKYVEKAREYMAGRGYTFKDTYTSTFVDNPTTWDIFAASTSNDSGIIGPTYDYLYAYDAEGEMQPRMAESCEITEYGKVYTIKIRPGQIWVDSQGRKVADVTADDWVAAAQHAADLQDAYTLNSYIEGFTAYMTGETVDFGTVGVKALDDLTLQYTLTEPCSYFMSLLQTNELTPLCRSYFLSQGGAFGLSEFSAASAEPSYVYGIDQDHIAVCGQFLCTNMTEKNSITCVLNPNYWNAENATLKAVELVYDDGSDVARNYENFKNGLNYSMYLNSALMETAKNNGDFDKYAVTNPPNKATFLLWFNLNRKTYANVADGALASRKTDEQKEITRAALQNKHFRLALAYSIDRPLYIVQNTVEELKYANNRNTLTPGDYVSLLEDVTIDINGTPTTFPKGTWYGAIVQAQLTADEFPIKVWDEELQTTDFPDAWHQPELAKKEMELAIEELATLGYKVSKENPIVLDYYNPVIDETSARMSYVLKTCIESGTDGNVFVDLIDMNAWSERNNMLNNVNYGYEVNEDMGGLGTVGSDHGDPQCFTEGLLPYGDGYMVIRMGLW